MKILVVLGLALLTIPVWADSSQGPSSVAAIDCFTLTRANERQDEYSVLVELRSHPPAGHPVGSILITNYNVQPDEKDRPRHLFIPGAQVTLEKDHALTATVVEAQTPYTILKKIEIKTRASYQPVPGSVTLTNDDGRVQMISVTCQGVAWD